MDIPLTSMSIDVTYKCNLQCRHCFNYSGIPRLREELTDEELLKLAQQVCDIDMGIESACLCGGEPLLRKEISYALIEKLREKINNVSLTSNGFLLDKVCAKKLKDVGVGNVQISLDGDTNSHNWIRDNDKAYERAMEAITNLLEQEIRVGVACTPNKMNFSSVNSLIDLMDDMGVYIFRMQPIMALGRAKTIHDFYLTSEDYLQLTMNLAEKREEGKKIIIEWGDPAQHLYYLGTGNRCKSISINPHGDILISPYLPISFGNIKSHKIGEYLSKGLLDSCVNNEILQTICLELGKNLEDVEKGASLPELYKDDFISIDIIDSDLDQECKKIQRKTGGN